MTDPQTHDGSQNPVGKTYKSTRFLRHPLTRKNQQELKTREAAVALLNKWREWAEWEATDPAERSSDAPPSTWRTARAKALQKTEDNKDRWLAPVGFSINKVSYGTYPSPTAHDLDWRTYMNIGMPLIEERSDIQQPPPDVIYQNTFVNRTDPRPVTWTATVEFSVSTQISWQLQGEVQLRFGAKATSSLQKQMQKSMAIQKYLKTTLLNSKDNMGVNVESQAQAASTTTATGTATGTGELSTELMLGITGSIGGLVTFQSRNSLQLSGQVDTRAVVRATQRRKVVKYDYELPITFGGYIALYYDEPVELASNETADKERRRKVQTRDGSGQTEPDKYTQVLAQDIDVLNLTNGKKYFSQKGEAEIVSTLAGDIEVFELEALTLNDGTNDGSEAYLYKKA